MDDIFENLIHGDLRIFIIDEDKYMVKILRNILLSIGVSKVDSAENEEGAMAKILEDGVDIIICDYDIAPTGGIDFCQKIRQHENKAIHELPIIMLSSQSEIKQVFEARDAGVNEFLIKPISAKSLSSRLQSVLMHPRRFVDAENFHGPDRRRRNERRLKETSLYQGNKRSDARRLEEN